MDEMQNKMDAVSAQSRVRINCSLTAKGLVQWDITSEFPSVEESATNLKEAITKCREVLVELGLQEAHA